MNILKSEIRDKSVVQNLIPQKAPFAMVDALLYYSEEKITAGLTVTKDNIFTKKGTFTAPGIIEHMAQTVALHTGYKFFLLNQEAPTGYIGSIKKVEILDHPKQDDQLETTVSIIAEFMDITMVKIICTCNGKTIAESEMKTVLAK